MNQLKESLPSVFVTEALRNISEAVLQHPLTVLCGGLGCGKTTVLRYLLRKHPRAFLHNASPGDPPGLPKQLADLLSEGDCAPAKGAPPLLFLVDDYHLIHTPALSRQLLQAAQDHPLRLHIVLAAREELWPPYSEEVRKQEVLQLDGSALAFTPAECAAYWRACRLHPSSADTRRLFSLSLGCPLVVQQLAAEALRSGQIRLPGDLKRMVLVAADQLPAPLPDFLARIAPVAHDFTPDKAEYLWQSGDPRPLLEELQRRCFFLHIDPRTGRYGFHPLLCEALTDRFARSGQRRSICYRLASYESRCGQPLEALRFYWQAGEMESFLAYLSHQFIPDWSVAAVTEVEGYYRALPRELFGRYPYALLQFGWHFFLHGREALQADCQLLYLKLMRDEALEESEWQGRTYAQTLYQAGLCRQLTELPGYYLSLGAHPRLEAARPFRYPLLFGCPTVFGAFYLPREAELARQLSLIEQCTDEACRQPLTCLLQAAHTELLFLSGDFDAARIANHRALRLSREIGAWNLVICARYLQAKFYFLRGRTDRVQEALSLMRRETAHRYGAQSAYATAMDLIDCRFLLYQGQLPLVARWLYNGDLEAVELLEPVRAYALSVRAHVMLVRGLLSQLAAMEDLLLTPQTPEVLRLYNHLLLCAAHEQLHRTEAANRQLLLALTLAKPHGLIMPFIELYSFLQPVLARCAFSWVPLRKRIPELGARFVRLCAAREKPLLLHSAQGLTPRENEVAHMAARGMYNREIAQQLGVSENTVKSALKSVFSKLSITSRRQLPGALQTGPLPL